MAHLVVVELYPMDILSPIGCHFFYNKKNQQWEVSLFASATEIVGGEKDGIVNSSNFSADLKSIAGIFTEVHRLDWQALSNGSEDEVGPHISFEGNYEGHEVWLRILASAPKRFEAGRKVNVYECQLEDVW
jgi:hypothetical protein